MDVPTFKIVSLSRKKNAKGGILYLPGRYLDALGISEKEDNICIMMHKDRIVISATKKGFLENLSKESDELERDFEIIDEKINKAFEKFIKRSS